MIAVAFSVPRSGGPYSTAEPSGGATTSIWRDYAQHLMSLKKMKKGFIEAFNKLCLTGMYSLLIADWQSVLCDCRIDAKLDELQQEIKWLLNFQEKLYLRMPVLQSTSRSGMSAITAILSGTKSIERW